MTVEVPADRARRREARRRGKRRPGTYYCPDCGTAVQYLGYYWCATCLATVPMGALACTNTSDTGNVGSGHNTTPQEDIMASRATRAAERLDQDRAKLTLVQPAPDPEPAPAARTAGDVARAAARDTLPAHQQAEYDRLITAGSRHVTALAGARKLPDPAAAPTSIEQAAADLFAAMAAGQAGAATPPVTVAAASGKPDSDPEPAPATPKLPVLTPEAAASLAAIRELGNKTPSPKQPKVKVAPVRPADPNAPVSAYDRHIGTVTATGLDGKEQTYDCEHGSRNGHMDVSSAETCARRLLRNHPGGVTGTRLHPVRRDRNGAKIAVPA